MAVVVMNKNRLEVREVEGKKYFLFLLGSESHGKPSQRIWIAKELVEEDEEQRAYLMLPKAGVRIEQGKKDKIMKKGELNAFCFYIQCGYRGSSDYQIESPYEELYSFAIYRSPQGSLGISAGALVLTKEKKVKIRWTRTGRTYGEGKEGVAVIYLDGRLEEVEGEPPDDYI